MTVASAKPGTFMGREMLPAVVLGLGLGTAALIPDLLTDETAALVTPVVSSGFAWGGTALVAGFLARRTQSAAIAGMGTLVLATVTYYCLTVATSPRWELNPADIEGSGSSLSYVLASVTRALMLWSIVSLCGGAVMGTLGHRISSGSSRHSSIAAGVAFGLLAGEGAYTIFHTMFIWVGPIDSFVWQKVLGAATQLILATVVVGLAQKRCKQARSWSTLVLAASASIIANVLFWHFIQALRLLV